MASLRPTAVLSDSIIVAVSRLFAPERDPAHSSIGEQVRRAGLSAVDPGQSEKPIGKEKRIRQILSWALEHEPQRGSALVGHLVALIRGSGGFRPTSQNYVGQEGIENARAAFMAEGYELALNGDLRPMLLDDLSGAQLTDALRAYVRRAQVGASDAALVTGTGKDLLEATAAHVLVERFGSYPSTANFPTLLGQAFVEVGLATTATPERPGEAAQLKVERALYQLGCAVNTLRNKEGTGHGRPFLTTVTDQQARVAVQAIGLISGFLLNARR